MTKITAYNTLNLNTEKSRVVATFEIKDHGSARLNLHVGSLTAAQWNRDETRHNMRVNFIMVDGLVRAL